MPAHGLHWHAPLIYISGNHIMPPNCIKFSCFSWRIVLIVPVKVIQQKNSVTLYNNYTLIIIS